MRKLVTLVALAGFAAPAMASDHLYIGSTVGHQWWDNDRFITNDEENVSVGVQIGYEILNDSLAFQLDLSTEVDGDSSADRVRLNMFSFLQGSSSFPGFTAKANRSGWTPYLVSALTFTDAENGPNTRVEEDFGVETGIGLSKYFDDNLEFRGDVRIGTALSTDGLADVDNFGYFDWGVNLAVNYHFGSHPHKVAPKPAPVVAPAPKPVVAPAPVVEPEPVIEMRTVTMQLNVQFATNSSDITAVYGEELDAIMKAMQDNGTVQLSLEGHTDSRGAAEYNQSLSQRRADSVKAKLIADYGIAPSRITSTGFGETRPIATNDTAEGRKANRRVVGIISWEEEVIK